jgi:hypothetical protein
MNLKNIFDLHKITKLPAISFLLPRPGLRGFWLLLFLTQFSFAQKKDENIGTEVVNVVKSYTPTISDASKVKEIPTIEEEDNTKKEAVKYTIFSFPVASTFTPYKGSAEGVDKVEKAKYFKNYLTFGGGNYGVLNAELFLNQDLNASDYVGGMVRHFSSQGGIKGVELSDNYNETAIDFTFGTNRKNLSWNLDLGYQNQVYNWYGLPAGFGSLWDLVERTTLLEETNEEQRYNSIYIGSRLDFNRGVLNDASVKFNHFSDAYGSAENRLCVKPNFQFEVREQSINTQIVFDYLKGNFTKDYWNTNAINYGYTNIGIAPSFELTEHDWKINLGFSLFYSADAETNNNQFLIYPKMNASLNVVEDLMVFYTGVDGNLLQNTYSDFVNQNPFVSPTLLILPTDKQFDIYAGLKGKLTHNISYNMRASYSKERNKSLFKSNEYADTNTSEGYTLGNSFGVVYDDIKTARFYGELKADFSEKLTLGVSSIFSSYSTSGQIEAWNLPTIQFNSNIDFDINENWYAGASLFFVGERKEQQLYLTSLTLPDPNFTNTLESYLDVNAHVGFKYSDRLTAYLKANNITNNNYQKWLNYPVQGFQIVLGANYKFDF